MPFRRHFARKELREHQEAQAALARGDTKSWHKHEAKAHRAGKHARSGLLHTDYSSFNEATMPMGPAGFPPVPMMPVEEVVMTPLAPIMGSFEEVLAPNTIVEVGEELEPEVIIEPTVIEAARTVVDYPGDALGGIEAYMNQAAGPTHGPAGDSSGGGSSYEDDTQYGEAPVVGGAPAESNEA